MVNFVEEWVCRVPYTIIPEIIWISRLDFLVTTEIPVKNKGFSTILMMDQFEGPMDKMTL